MTTDPTKLPTDASDSLCTAGTTGCACKVTDDNIQQHYCTDASYCAPSSPEGSRRCVVAKTCTDAVFGDACGGESITVGDELLWCVDQREDRENSVPEEFRAGSDSWICACSGGPDRGFTPAVAKKVAECEKMRGASLQDRGEAIDAWMLAALQIDINDQLLSVTVAACERQLAYRHCLAKAIPLGCFDGIGVGCELALDSNGQAKDSARYQTVVDAGCHACDPIGLVHPMAATSISASTTVATATVRSLVLCVSFGAILFLP